MPGTEDPAGTPGREPPRPTDPARAARKARRAGLRADRGQVTATEGFRTVGNEFLWIAGLSLLGSISFYASAGSGIVFFMGLGATLLADSVAVGLGPATGGISLAVAGLLDCMIACGFVVIGLFGREGRGWAVLLGGLVYAADGLLCAGMAMLEAGPTWWYMAGFHAFVCLALVARWKASRQASLAAARSGSTLGGAPEGAGRGQGPT